MEIKEKHRTKQERKHAARERRKERLVERLAGKEVEMTKEEKLQEVREALAALGYRKGIIPKVEDVDESRAKVSIIKGLTDSKVGIYDFTKHTFVD